MVHLGTFSGKKMLMKFGVKTFRISKHKRIREKSRFTHFPALSSCNIGWGACSMSTVNLDLKTPSTVPTYSTDYTAVHSRKINDPPTILFYSLTLLPTLLFLLFSSQFSPLLLSPPQDESPGHAIIITTRNVAIHSIQSRTQGTGKEIEEEKKEHFFVLSARPPSLLKCIIIAP